MKIKTFNITYPNKNPSKCDHEWRMFGTRLEEEVWTPIRYGPRTCGWVICDKCGWNPYASEYKIIGNREYFPFGKENKKEGDISWNDVMVEVIKLNDECPTKPVIVEFAYAEQTWWDKTKKWFKEYGEVIAETLGSL
jgi:hypothetical protein